jgi:hypothetical protein
MAAATGLPDESITNPFHEAESAANAGAPRTAHRRQATIVPRERIIMNGGL